MQLREYQVEAVNKTVEYLSTPNPGHPIIVMPTGSGKTIIICEFINQYLSDKIGSNVLVLSHVKEILEQDYKALTEYFDGYEVGLYSQGLDSKTIRKITVAGIQSVWRSPNKFNHFDIIIIDECHLVTIKQTGMYRKFLNQIEANYIGLTATPFRLGHGYIHQGKGALFTDIVYDLSSSDNFNKLVEDGYLTKLITKSTIMEMNTDKIRIRAGDFAQNDLSKAFDRKTITDNAVNEIVKFGKNYKKWLIFAIDIEHAEHISGTLSSYGVKSLCIHSKMDGDRLELVRDFKEGGYRAIVNVDILTTGFDVPEIDLIAMLRPTKSPVIHVQTIGRGLRIAANKSHCLVLDFAGNTERLGPINYIQIKNKEKSEKKGEPITKKCPDCGCVYHPTVKICDACGHEFIFKEKLKASASVADIVRGELEKWISVSEVTYSIYRKSQKPDSLLVTYQCGLSKFKEWVCFAHKGYAKYKADAWVRYRMNGYRPEDLGDLYKNSHLLKKPIEIKVNTADKFARIVDSRF